MIFITRKDKEEIEATLKKYKKRAEEKKTIKLLRAKQFYIKPKVKRKKAKELARYKQIMSTQKET